jgi:hypothetical protein
MKSILRNFPYAIIVVLFAYIFVLRECADKHGPCPEIKTDTVVTYKVDTITIVKHYPAPKPTIIIDSVYIWKTADTIKECIELSNDYASFRIYNRHLVVDTLGWIDLADTVHNNKLRGYTVNSYFKAYTKTYYIDRVLTTPKRFNAFIGLNFNSDITITPSVMIKTKRENYYQVGYNPFSKVAHVGGYWKLF